MKLEKQNVNSINKNNRNDKNQNKDNKYSDVEYDKDIVDVFLGANIRLLNQNNINKISIAAPTRPKLEANTVNIKSVCISGK